MANEVVINVRAMTGDATKSMKDLKGRMQGMATSARTAGIALSAMGAGGALAIKGFVNAAIEQNKALDTLGAVVATTGADFDAVKGKILETTAALQAKTNFGDEAQIRTLTILTTILGDVDQAMAALPAVMDASSASGLQMESVAKTMGKALAGTVHQAESVGLVFDKTAGFSERLDQVFGKVGGAAEANADPFTQMGNSLGDLKETIGNALIPVLTPLVGWLTKLFQKMQNANPTLLKIGAVLAVVATGFALVAGPVLLLISMIPSLVAGIALVKGAFIALAGSTGIGLIVVALGMLAVLFVTKFDFIKETVGNALQFILDKFIEWGRSIAEPIDALINTFNQLTGTSIPLLSEKLDQLSEVTIDWSREIEEVDEAVNDVDKSLGQVGQTMNNKIVPATKNMKQAADDALSPFLEYGFRLQAMKEPMEDLSHEAQSLAREFGISMSDAIDFIANIKLAELDQRMRESAEKLLGMGGGGAKAPYDPTGGAFMRLANMWSPETSIMLSQMEDAGAWVRTMVDRANAGGTWNQITGEVSEPVSIVATVDGDGADKASGNAATKNNSMNG